MNFFSNVSLFLTGHREKNKFSNIKEPEQHAKRKGNNNSVYWNSNLKDVETNHQYFRQEYQKTRKQKEQHEEQNIKKSSDYTDNKTVGLSPLSTNHFNERGYEDFSRRLTSTRKKKANLMESLKISTTANGRVVEIEKYAVPKSEKAEEQANFLLSDKFSEMKLTNLDDQRRPSEKPRVKGNKKHPSISGKLVFHKH